MNNEADKEKVREFIASIKMFIKEKELEFGVNTQGSDRHEILTESELIDIFGVSRTTLYRGS